MQCGAVKTAKASGYQLHLNCPGLALPVCGKIFWQLQKAILPGFHRVRNGHLWARPGMLKRRFRPGQPLLGACVPQFRPRVLRGCVVHPAQRAALVVLDKLPRNRPAAYAEGVQHQSPGSRSAPWVMDAGDTDVPRRGTTRGLRSTERTPKLRLWNPFRVLELGSLPGTQGALRDPGLRCATPTA
jgi:hypothetical protein